MPKRYRTKKYKSKSLASCLKRLQTNHFDRVIDSLASEFESIFKDFHQWTGWGVTLVAGGPDPYTGVVRTAG